MRSQSNRSGFETIKKNINEIGDPRLNPTVVVLKLAPPTAAPLPSCGLNPTVVVLKPPDVAMGIGKVVRLNPTVVVLKQLVGWVSYLVDVRLNPTVVVLKPLEDGDCVRAPVVSIQP